MPSIGETLRTTRLSKGRTLEDVSRVTKIKVEILERLEADDYRAVGAPTYVKGFIRLYGDYLGLDGRALGEAYLESQGGLRRQGLRLETQATLMAERQRELRLPLGAVVAVVGGITLLWLIWWGVHTWETRRLAPAKVQSLPHVNVEPLYRPRLQIGAELLEPHSQGR
ncbi:MAG: helix-turn-helix domain-containing protein [Verrucomicrobiae bacterium]|nr:helix-turn-helix domain-containing protein [Verrucomicrobiae bacterium]